MRSTGKTFRRRRADSESEEDEQESEEVRYVLGRVFTGQKERDRLTAFTGSQGCCLSEAPRDKSDPCDPGLRGWERCPAVAWV